MSQQIKNTFEFTNQLIQSLREGSRQTKLFNYKPYDKQVEFHQSTAIGRGFFGGNRAGKTVAGCTEACWLLLGNHPYKQMFKPPVYGRAVTTDIERGIKQILIPQFQNWLAASDLRGGSWDNAYDDKGRVLHLANGSFIEFMTYEQDIQQFQGVPRHFVWFDEEPTRAIFDECLARLVDFGGYWWMTMTPVFGMTWVYDDIFLPATEANNPDISIFTVDQEDNPYINQEHATRLAKVFSEETRKARQTGVFTSSGGFIYLPYIIPEVHVIEPFIPSKEWLWVMGMDSGFRNPTCWLWAAIDPLGSIYVFDEHYEADRVVEYHANVIKAKNQAYVKAGYKSPDYAVGDPSIAQRNAMNGESVHTEYAKNEIYIALANNDQTIGINRIIHMLQKQKLFMTRNCTNLLREMKQLRWGTYVQAKIRADRNKQESQHKKNDHAPDALRYLVMSRPEFDDGTLTVDNMSGLLTPMAGVDPFTDRQDPTFTKPSLIRAGYDSSLGTEW